MAVFGFVCLAAAAVWMGGLNQDEGWYLYAANLVAEGRMPYRDFFYTQGPMLPIVYSAFAWVWKTWGILGARIFTLGIGTFGVLLAAALARRLAPEGRKGEAALVVLLLLGSNIYHLYYVTIPKTYALASLFVMAGFLFLSKSFDGGRRAAPVFVWSLAAGVSLAFASGARISLGLILCVVGVYLLWSLGRGGSSAFRWWRFAGFVVGGFAALGLVYGPFLLSAGARAGLFAAQAFHTARGGFDLTWTVGSLSRLVRWYLPLFVVLGLGVYGLLSARRRAAVPATAWVAAWSFAAVFALQMLAPFPYEDYNVPIMGSLAVFAAVLFAGWDCDAQGARPRVWAPLLVLGMTWASSFGSPMLEKWSTNGQDRFWSIKKEKFELAQLRDVARRIEALDPGGKELFTQDVYLAIETNRRVPKGFELGPFSVLSDAEIEKAIAETESPVAALSGYCFAIDMPVGSERPIGDQMRYWEHLKKKYTLAHREEAFGQNSTPLLILRRR